MYQVFYNDYPLHDLRDERLILRDPDVHLAVAEAGSMAFIIDHDHPYLDQLARFKGVVELRSGGLPIFKGRIRKDIQHFDLSREIEVEGLLACLNDSIIPPFTFPDDFPEAENADNVVEYFLGWLLDQHNSQVGPEQQIQLGDVTVSDPNNYIYRASSDYLTTMEAVRKKLEDLMGGYLLADYSGETTVLHYYADLPLTNVQTVEFGKNLLELVSELDSADTYTAILPVGKDGLTIAELPDGEISPGVVKSGLIVYSVEAEEEIDGGRVTRKVAWSDVTDAGNLRTKAAAQLTGEGVKTLHTISASALDLGLIEEDLPRFMVGRYVRLNSAPHGFAEAYPLMELDPDILDPGNTQITMGAAVKTSTAIHHAQQSATQEQLDKQHQELQGEIIKTKEDLEGRIDGIDGTYFYVRYSAYADGRNMTTAPADDTLYMGTCSTNQATAPTDYREYTWARTRGEDGANGTPGEPGADGRTQYLHIKYSDDGQTFTDNDGEELGAWIGTLVDFTEADSMVFSDYTWKKFTEDVDEELDSIKRVVTEQRTEIISDCESIILAALESYVETSDYGTFKETVESELVTLADKISMNFTTTTEHIQDVDGDLQAKFSEVYKFIAFSGDTAITIGGSSGLELTLDNDGGIIFSKNGVAFGHWDGNDFYTGNIVVNVSERAQFGQFAFIPRSDGSLSFLMVGTPPAAFRIVRQPVGSTVTVGTAFELSVLAVGTGLTYLWQQQAKYNGAWVNSWADLPSNTAPEVFIVPTAAGTQRYRCVIEDANGNTLTTNVAEITITAA